MKKPVFAAAAVLGALAGALVLAPSVPPTPEPIEVVVDAGPPIFLCKDGSAAPTLELCP